MSTRLISELAAIVTEGASPKRVALRTINELVDPRKGQHDGKT